MDIFSWLSSYSATSETTATVVSNNSLSFIVVSITMMFLSLPIWIYLFFPSLQVSGFRELFRHYILRIPDPDRSWLSDAQFVESNYGKLYQEIHNSEYKQRLLKESQQNADVTHFLFLVHGVNGYALDLSYPEMMLKLLRDEKKLQLIDEDNTNTETRERKQQHLVVHAATCNERKTKDGIIRGGLRLYEEMVQVIQQEMKNKKKKKNSKKKNNEITISMFGNSLGGLYCRYAIAEFYRQQQSAEEWKNYTVRWNVFLTTATPHLGCANHTYFPLPRVGEIGLAHTMGETGKDLFQVNDLLKRMATEPPFINSLKGFRKRIAYANAYGTDFPVPTATAAFLHERSTYPHHDSSSASSISSSSDSDNNDYLEVLDEKGLVIANLHTHPLIEDDDDNEHMNDDDDDRNENTDDLLLMSNSLDSLGWKKVFVDLRHEIPIGVKLPPSPFKKNNADNDSNNTPLKDLKRVESKEVASATKRNGSNRIIYPLGHNMIVAVSRCDKSASFNSGGRPVIDALAKELVELIFTPYIETTD